MKIGDLVNFSGDAHLGLVVGFTQQNSPIIRWSVYAIENDIYTNGAYIEEYLEVVSESR
jgi:hypothetical protein